MLSYLSHPCAVPPFIFCCLSPSVGSDLIYATQQVMCLRCLYWNLNCCWGKNLFFSVVYNWTRNTVNKPATKTAVSKDEQTQPQSLYRLLQFFIAFCTDADKLQRAFAASRILLYLVKPRKVHLKWLFKNLNYDNKSA